MFDRVYDHILHSVEKYILYRENLIYSQTFKQNYRYSQTYFEIPKIATTLIRKITPSIKRRITILIHKFHRPNHSEPK